MSFVGPRPPIPEEVEKYEGLAKAQVIHETRHNGVMAGERAE